ncbi:MAG: hypothetical protein ABJA98_32015 [Acidobacteriota bacterium]
MRRGLTQQPTPLRQPRVDHLWGQPWDRTQPDDVAVDGAAPCFQLPQLRCQRHDVARRGHGHDQPVNLLGDFHPFPQQCRVLLLRVVALREQNHLLDGLFGQGVGLHRGEHGLVQVRDGDVQAIRTGTVGATAMADVFRPPPALLAPTLHDETAAAEAARGHANQQVVHAVFPGAAQHPAIFKPQRPAFRRGSPRLHASPERVGDDARGGSLQPFGLRAVGGCPRAIAVLLARPVPQPHAAIRLSVEHGPHGGRSPANHGREAVRATEVLRCGGAVTGQLLGDAFQSEARVIHLEDANHHGGLVRIDLQLHMGPERISIPVFAVEDDPIVVAEHAASDHVPLLVEARMRRVHLLARCLTVRLVGGGLHRRHRLL